MRSVAAFAVEKPTSARLNVSERDELFQLIRTEVFK